MPPPGTDASVLTSTPRDVADTAGSTIDAEFTTVGGDNGLHELYWLKFFNPEPGVISDATLETIADRVKTDYQESSTFEIHDTETAVATIKRSIRQHLGFDYAMKLMGLYQPGKLTRWLTNETF